MQALQSSRAMTRRRVRLAWMLAAGLTLANPLLHKSVSDVCDWANGRLGFTVYNRTALVGIPLASILAALLALGPGRARLLRPAPLAAALVLAVMSVAAHRWLLVVNIELVHFPQFALVAAVLLAAGLRGPDAYLGATVAGIVDETYQHLVVYAGRPDTYFDINDIVLNAIGAAWGVVLVGDRFRGADHDRPVAVGSHAVGGIGLTWPWGAALALLALPAALWLDPPRFSPLLQATPSGRTMYRVLSTPEGMVVCAGLWIMLQLLERHEETPRPPC